MNPIKKIKLSNILYSALYILLIITFLLNTINLSNSYKKFEDKHIQAIEEQLHEVINNSSSDKELQDGLKELVNQNSMEVSLSRGKDNIYSSVAFNYGSNKMNRLNPQAVLFEAQGNYEEFNLWYAIYSINNVDYSRNFLLIQSFISVLSLILISWMFFNTRKQMTAPLEQIKEGIHNIKQYQFDLIKQSDDIINQDFYTFSSNLEKTIDNVTRSYSQLELELKAQGDRLENIITVSKSLVHNLKTPAHLIYLENQHKLHSVPEEDQKTIDFVQNNIDQSDKLLNQINQTLNILQNNEMNYLSELEHIDVSNLFHETIRTFESNIRLKNNYPNIDFEDNSSVFSNLASLQILIFNLVSNSVTYSTENSEISYIIRNIDNGIELITINDSSTDNITRIKNSENLFTEMAPRSDNKFSSGVGMFIIKDMIKILDGEYLLETDGSTVTVSAKIYSKVKS